MDNSKTHDIRGTGIIFDGERLERVNKLVYLGSNINDQWDQNQNRRSQSN